MLDNNVANLWILWSTRRGGTCIIIAMEWTLVDCPKGSLARSTSELVPCRSCHPCRVLVYSGW